MKIGTPFMKIGPVYYVGATLKEIAISSQIDEEQLDSVQNWVNLYKPQARLIIISFRRDFSMWWRVICLIKND